MGCHCRNNSQPKAVLYPLKHVLISNAATVHFTLVLDFYHSFLRWEDVWLIYTYTHAPTFVNSLSVQKQWERKYMWFWCCLSPCYINIFFQIRLKVYYKKWRRFSTTPFPFSSSPDYFSCAMVFNILYNSLHSFFHIWSPTLLSPLSSSCLPSSIWGYLATIATSFKTTNHQSC